MDLVEGCSTVLGNMPSIFWRHTWSVYLYVHLTVICPLPLPQRYRYHLSNLLKRYKHLPVGFQTTNQFKTRRDIVLMALYVVVIDRMTLTMMLFYPIYNAYSLSLISHVSD